MDEDHCPICEKRYSRYLKPVKDHDHETGKFRGIICSGCNATLGMIENGSQLDSLVRRLVHALDVALRMQRCFTYLRNSKQEVR